MSSPTPGPCAQCGLGLAPAPVAWPGLGSLTVADCPWPVLANICKHCTAQAAARHMATCVTRAIANITVHGQFLKTANAIPLMATVWALLAPIVMRLMTKRLSELDIGHWQPRPVLSFNPIYQVASPVSFVISGLETDTVTWTNRQPLDCVTVCKLFW